MAEDLQSRSPQQQEFFRKSYLEIMNKYPLDSLKKVQSAQRDLTSTTSEILLILGTWKTEIKDVHPELGPVVERTERWARENLW